MAAMKRVYSGDELHEHRKAIDARKFHYDAQRAAKTQALVSFQFLRGDLHTHSRYSDGKGTIAENWATAEARGLDFHTAGSINNGSRLTATRLLMAAAQRYGRYDG